MPLAYQMDSIDGVHEEVAKLYTESDGKFILTGVEGVSPKSKVDEFRTTNIDLNNKLKSFEGLDPVKYKSMDTEIKELRIRLDKTDLSEEQIEKIVAGRVEQMSNDFKEKESNYSTTIKTQSEKINVLVLDGSTKEAAIEHGIAESAIADVTSRVRNTFSINEQGKAIGKDSEGNVLYDATGQKEMTINEWVKGLVKTAPHLFKESVRSKIPGHVTFKGDPSKLSAMQKIAQGLG